MVVTVDGRETGCAKKVIENIGIEPQAFFLTKLGLEKGKTIPSPELTEKICGEIARRSEQARATVFRLGRKRL
jgi:uncharacterized metal-binding protein